MDASASCLGLNAFSGEIDVTTVGTIESLWRYPVKSMAGEALTELFVGCSGIYGDRCFAFENSAARKGFPYLNATAKPEMLCYQPRFRYPDRAAKPPNLAEAMKIEPGVNPANARPDDLTLDVLTPSGTTVAVDDPALIDMLGQGMRVENQITLTRSDRALTDCRPVSMISLETIWQIEAEMGKAVDKRRFRANIYVNLASGKGFGEDEWVGRRIRIGQTAEIMVLERDPRCKMISLDPDTGEHNPEIFRKVVQEHGNYAGVYCAVLVEGLVTRGSSIEVVD